MKLPVLEAHYKLWISLKDGKGILGDGKWRLLKEIEQSGSISKAAEKLDISYRKAWGDIRNIEQLMKITVVNKQRGGSHGGRTYLTNDGILLLQAYDLFHSEINKSFEQAFKKFIKHIDSSF